LNLKNLVRISFILLAIYLLNSSGLAFNQSQKRGKEYSSSLLELWQQCKANLPPFHFEILQDEIVPSSSVPGKNLRRLEVRFTSQVVGQWGRRMAHTAVIFLPVNPEINQRAEKRGKAVVIAHRYGDQMMIDDYAEPIAAILDYPTMILPIPGEYDGHDGESCWMYFFRSHLLSTQDPIYHPYFRLAISYIRALDVFQEILGEEKIRAVIGGHSKRAPSAFNAAALDPERVAGVIYMGMESTFARYEGNPWEIVSPVHSQEGVKCPVFYIGATNEDGYEMFNINRLQAKMKNPWTIEMIPNFHHATYSEIQIKDWMMWISHIFDGRPLTRISDLSYKENEEGTFFQARIDSPNKIIAVKVWYVYCDDVPYWRDLMWYPLFMKQEGEFYKALLPGKTPDAWLVEVKDKANGLAGYLSSLPLSITRKPTKERYSRGWRSRNWESKTKRNKSLSLDQ
jgi:pimeloyl-ACP methyl ester carboxylesterase